MDQKNISFTINNEFSFIGSFQFLSYLLDSFIKTLSTDEFKYLYQEFDHNVSDLVQQKRSYLYKYMNDFEKFKQQLPRKEKFYIS